MLKQNIRIQIPVAKKLLSVLLCTSLICSSVIPAWSGVPRGKGLARALRGVRVSGSRLPTSGFSEALSRGVLSQIIFSRTTLQPRILAGQTAGLADFILQSPAAERGALLRNDFVALSLVPQAVSPVQRASALEAYQTQLKSAGQTLQVPQTDLNTFLQEAAANPQQQELVAAQETLADAAAIALLGTRSQAPALLQFYEASQGTIFENTAALITARGLLQMRAYDEFNQFVEQVEHKEVLAGTVAYARANGLPVNELPEQFANVPAVTLNEPLAEFLGSSFLPNELHADASMEATGAWMNLNSLEFPAMSSGERPLAATITANIGTPIADAQPMMLQVPSFAQTGEPGEALAAQNLHAFRDQGLASEGMEATFPVYWEDVTSGKTLDVTFQFENQAAKEVFYNRVDLAPNEFFVFDRGTGGIIIRQELTAEQKAGGAKAKDRGFFKVFFEGGQKTPLALYKVLFAREMGPAFQQATKISEVMTLLSAYRNDLKQILSPELLAKYPLLNSYLGAKSSILEHAANELLQDGKMMEISHDIAAEMSGLLAENATAATPIKVFKDDIGHWAQNFAGFAEGTFGTMGQANTSALGLLNISKGFLSNLPTAAGQFGPAWAPFIGAWAEKYGTKTMLNIGQLLGAGGHLGAGTSLMLGALGVLPPIEAFAGMVGGITVNGVAGSILKQINPMVAKQRASDPVSSSATITDLNSWASVGGMYCYLFLPAVGAATWLLTGEVKESLAALAAMFGVASAIPLTANVLLRKSRIQNVVKTDAARTGVFKTIGNNLKFGFKSPFLRTMFLATAGGHFMGLGFNSGPGHFIKENIASAPVAMAVSFLSIYLTVFAGRKLGAKAMQKGFIGDKALAGLSGLVGVTMGAASLIPGLDFASRCMLFAAAGLGFSNWVNVLQSIELSRPENVGKEAAVSSMYILARTSGMLTMLMGAFGDSLGAMMGLSPSTAALYALTMPLAAGTASMLLNRHYITQDLWPTAKRWVISSKNWIKTKLHIGDNGNPEVDAPQDPTPVL